MPLGCNMSPEITLVDSLISIAKLDIYKTRKAKLLANPDILCDVIIVFQALVTARIRTEFSVCQRKDDLL